MRGNTITAHSHFTERIIRYVQPSGTTLLLGLAIAVGLAAGVFIWVFRQGIELFHVIFAEGLAETILGGALASWGVDPRLSLPVMLALAGLLVGFIAKYLIGPEKYHGVAGIMESVALSGGRLPYAKMPLKALAAAISLGVGASVGPEDPSVQIGSHLGAFLGQRLRLSEDRVRLLVSAGAASAIAAAFNAPIAGVFFALEVVLGEFTTGSFSIVVLAAVIAAAFTQAIGSGSAIFGGLEYTVGKPLELLPYFAALGLIMAFVSSAAIRLFHWQHDVWQHTIKLPRPLETAITGAAVGFVAIFLPQIMGPGELFMHDVLSGHAEIGLGLLLILALAKLVMTAISLGGGFAGGVFAPTLFIGIMMGTAYGEVINRFAPPELVGSPQIFAIAGMAALLAGIVRAPITAILLVFELTNDYAIILPIMITSVICTVLVERIGPAGIYKLSLIKHGIHLQEGRDIDVMQGVTVGEAMLSPAPVIAENAMLVELRDALSRSHRRALCVVDERGYLSGIAALDDLQRVYTEAKIHEEINLEKLTVGDICARDVVMIAPDDPLFKAVRVMGQRDIGHLPVVKENTRELVGMIRRHDVMDAYNMVIARKFKDQHTAEQIRLNTLTGACVMEYTVKRDTMVDGKLIRDIKFPPGTVVASILRHGKLIVPQGDTELKRGDVVTIVADEKAEPIVAQLFSRRELAG